MEEKQKKWVWIIGLGLLFWWFMFRKTGPPTINNIVEDLAKHPTKIYSKRDLDKIDKIVVHHSATTSGTPYAYATYHVNNRDWPGIGYHFVIDKDGTINMTNYIETRSYHTQNQNTKAIGICMTGNFDVQIPTAAQLQSLDSLIYYLRSYIGRNLSVHEHNEFANKSCAGENVTVEKYNLAGMGDLIGTAMCLESDIPQTRADFLGI